MTIEQIQKFVEADLVPNKSMKIDFKKEIQSVALLLKQMTIQI